MRKKTTERHKLDNTFRFQGEQERRRNIIVNAAVNLRDGLIYTGDADDSDSSQLFKALSHWNDLNQHTEFSDLLIEIGPDVKTLPQVIYQKERIINLLLEKITVSSEPYLDGVLGLIDAAVRDLQQEFIPFLPNVLINITELILTTKSAQIVELCLNSYSKILKNLRSHVLDKFGRYLKIFVRLLGGVNVKPYIIENASKSFEFVASKKAKVNPVQFLLKLFGILKTSNIANLQEGIATLLCTMMTSKSAFRPITFSHCLSFITEVQTDIDSDKWEGTVLKLVQKLKESKNFSTTNTTDLWSTIKESITSGLFSKKFLYCLRVMNQTMRNTEKHSSKSTKQPTHKNINNHNKAVISLIVEQQKEWIENSTIKSELMMLVCNLIEVGSLDVTSISLIKTLVQNLNLEQWENFDTLLQSHHPEEYLKLTPIMGDAYRTLLEKFSSDESTSRLLLWYSNILIGMEGGIILPKDIENHPANRFSGSSLPCYFFKGGPRTTVSINDTTGLTFLAEKMISENFISQFKMRITNEEQGREEQQEEECLRFLFILRQLDLNQHATIKNDLLDLIQSISSQIIATNSSDIQHKTLFPILYMGLEAVSTSCDGSELLNIFPKNFFETLIDWSIIKDVSHPKFSIWALKFLDLFLYVLQKSSIVKKRQDISLIQLLHLTLKDISKLSENLLSGFKIVRTLTLSIMQACISSENESTEYSGLHHIFQTSLTNELNEFDLISLDHDQNYHKLEQYIREVSGAKLEIILKYTLGLMFQNCTKIWGIVINLATLILKKLGHESFWRIFSPRFILLHTNDNIQKSIIEDDFSNGLLKSLKCTTFGFMKSPQASHLELEDKLDFVHYKVNMWKIILTIEPPIPTYIQDEVLLRIHNLHSLTASPRPFVGIKKDPESKAALSVLIPALEVLLQCPNSLGGDSIQIICLSLLPGPKNIQKSIITILCSMSQTIRDFIAKMEDIGDDQWLKKVHLMSFSGPNADFIPSDRQLFIDFILRLLLSLDAETKGSSKDIINKFLYNCTEEEVQRYTNYLLGSLSDWEALKIPPLKAIIAHINNISNMLTSWRYQFPTVMIQLIERVCQFVMLIEKVYSGSPKQEEEVNGSLDENVIQHRKKTVLSAARTCIVKFFDLFEALQMPEKTLNLIFESLIWSTKEDMSIYSSNSISWLLQLMMTWSKCPRYHILFTKCQNHNSETAVMHKMFTIFESKFLKPKPRLHLIEVVSNLGDRDPENEKMDIDEDEDYEEKMIQHTDPIECGECLEVDMSDGSLGVGILLSGKEKMFRVIADKSFFQDSALFQNATDKYIKFLRLFAQHSNNQKTNEQLSCSIIDILPKFRVKPFELVELYELVGDLLSSFQPRDSLVVKLGSCLTWTYGKGPREALCQAIWKIMKNKNHAQLIQDINAYNSGVSDEPNFKKRHEAFEKLESIIPKSNSIKTVLFSLLTSNCFYSLSHETDTGMLLIAQGLLKTIAMKLESFSTMENFGAEEEKKIHSILETSIIPRLKIGVKNKADPVFDNYLNALSVFGQHCHTFHGTMKGIHAVFQHGDQDVLLELQDIQLSVKARAANKFESLWPIMRSEPKIVIDFAIPILSHHLLDKNKLRVSYQNMIQCSLDALKWCTIALPHAAYFKYLDSVLEIVPNDEPMLLKQYHKLLGNIIDAYHYELHPDVISSLKETGIEKMNCDKNKSIDAKIDTDNEKVETMEVEEKRELLNNNTNNNNDDSIDEEQNKKEPTITIQLNLIESKSCLTTISKKFIPRLRKYLNLEEKASHKLSKIGSHGNDSMIKKIPTTLAYVKLLQKLPKEIRKSHMIWVIPTLCSSLNSKLISVRRNVRETLAKIVEELGPDVFPDIVRSCKSYLTRGFQKHVRNYTLLYILQTLTDTFKSKPKCVPVKDIIVLVEDELFGYMQEDKEVQAILSATPEAKRKNGLQLLYQCGMYVSPDSLDVLIKCPIERARTAKTLQTIKTGKEWMSEISKGLLHNDNVSSYDILNFLFAQMETYCQFSQSEIPNQKVSNVPSKLLTPILDSFILPKDSKQVAKEGKLALGIVVSWFIFCTLVDLLKDERLDGNDKETLAILNSFAKVIVQGKRDDSFEIRTPSLRCLVFMFSLPLKVFDDPKFLKTMWQKYFLAINDSNINEEINMYYKFLTTFYVTFTDHKIDLADLKLLIKCIFKHLQENKCTGSALVLLRNILQRKLISDDLISLIKEVRRHIWTDSLIHLQEGCRTAYLIYMKNYLRSQEEFMADFYRFFEKLKPDIQYNVAHSILMMIASMIQIIPDSWFTTTFSSNLSMDLVTALCRLKDPMSQKLITDSCMKTLFDRLGPQDGLEILKELQDNYCLPNMISYQRELCIAIRKIIEHKRCWGSEAVTLKAFSILSEILKPIPFSKLKTTTKVDLKQEYRDHGIFQGILAVSHSLSFVFSSGSMDSEIFTKLEEMLMWIRTEYLKYSHEWVQSTSVKCTNSQVSHIIELLGQKQIMKLKKDRDFMAPLYSDEHLLFLIRQYTEISSTTKIEETKTLALDGLVLLGTLAAHQDKEAFHEKLLKRLRYCVNTEVRESPTDTVNREAVFKFCRQYVSQISEKNLKVIQYTIVRMTTRDITDSNCPQEIVSICKAVQDKFKERLGEKTFIQLFSQARDEFHSIRENNRAKKKEQVIRIRNVFAHVPQVVLSMHSDPSSMNGIGITGIKRKHGGKNKNKSAIPFKKNKRKN